MSASDFYTAFAAGYDRLARAPGVERIRRRFARSLAPPTGGRVVEFGCGTGANHPSLREQIGPDGTYLGIDLAPGVLRIARRRESGPHTGFVRGDAVSPPVGGRTTSEAPDAVCATFLVGMLSAPAAAVRRWARLVGAGGGVGLLNLRRTAVPVARPFNPAFAAFVRLGSPPAAGSSDERPVDRLDRRVTDAHDALRAVCVPDSVRREPWLGGFGLCSTGTVASFE